jgi:hypothetical protein
MINYDPILPSGLLEKATEDDNNYLKYLGNDITLKVGVILKTIELEDEGNNLKIAPEYTVMTSGDENITIYNNCISAESFGNAADFFTAKLRQTNDANKVKASGSLNNQDGAMVLLLCLKGKSEQGIILKSLAHPNKKTVLTKEAGLHMEGEYNGINWQVNKDGELTVTFKSASNIKDGKVEYVSEETGGAFAKIDKTGSIEVNDGKAESIRIDKVKQTIDIKAEKNISSTTQASFNITAKENLNANCDMDLLIAAQGKADLYVKKDMNVEITGMLKGKAKKIELEAETMTKIKTKQIMIEADMADCKIKQFDLTGSQVNINASSINLGAGGTPAVTMSTMFLGYGFAGTPVISSAFAGFSTTVFIA